MAQNVQIEKAPVENLSIPSAAGYDIEKHGDSIKYIISLSSYIFQEGEGKPPLKKVAAGEALSIGQTRQSRQKKLGKSFTLGLEKVYVISEESAEIGIRSILDILFNNQRLNDTALMVVCKGKAEEILNFDVIGHPTSADYLQDMINNSKVFNFFNDNYKLIDVFVRVDAEGRRVIVPYIEISQNELQITGLALFKNDKLIRKIDIKDARALNMLSVNAGKGLITVQKSSKIFADYYAKVKRKINCTKKDGKFVFDIKLDFKGDITTNEYIKEAKDDIKEKEKLEKEIEEVIEKDSNEIINKMQKEYKMDCLELGRIAAAKYGRDTGIDWDEVVSNSEINVKASVKIVKQGRGDY